MRYLTLILFCLTLIQCYAQKKVIDQSVYDSWKSLGYAKISNNGKYICYEINPQKGDGYLYIYNVETGITDSISRGRFANFSYSNRFLVFKIKPGIDTLKVCELKKIDKKKWPGDTLGIYLLDKDSLIKIPNIKYYSLSNESDWMIFMHDENLERKTAKRKRCKKSTEVAYKSSGRQLSVFHPDETEMKHYGDVKKYEISDDGRYVAFTTHKKVKCDSIFMNILNTETNELTIYPSTYTDVNKLSFNKQGEKLAFIYSSDSTKNKAYGLQLIDVKNLENLLHIDLENSVIPNGKDISYNQGLVFTDDGKRLFFGVDELDELTEDTLIESEKVNVDIWSHKDPRLQPEQLAQLEEDKKASDLYVYDLTQNRVLFIASDTSNVKIDKNQVGDFVLARSSEPYKYAYNWEVPHKADYYRISLKTGKIELLSKAQRFGVKLSPSGRFFAYYDLENKGYMMHDIEDKGHACMNCEAKGVNWLIDINGQPREASPYAFLGWNRGENRAYLQSEFDVWEYKLDDDTLISISGEIGKEQNIRISTLNWTNDSVYIDFDNTFFKGFDENTKGNHFYKYESHGDHWDLIETGYYDAEIYDLARSKNKKQYLLRKMTFKDYPELYTFNGDLMAITKISNTNPQQVNYYWGEVEHVAWKSYEGRELEGLLYKPEKKDVLKKHPMIVYFYELYSDKIHTHYIPKPTRAALIYSVAEYVSAGYYVFVPDILYTPGHPAKSAYDCIVSGTEAMVKSYPQIDSTRMGLQGQSWGGYQTAQLVTMTNRYRAAMAGAPVSNMFSAYGGIRWESGMNRQFQYERTQSRIGYTIWEKPELYIENSPIFHIPNITTPLLIMHNDHDGAVPWYQGIEMFTAMKRLNKKVWLLNYNDDKHNLSRYPNKVDLSIRMRQFFDHYLWDKPMPDWMENGLPAIEKGKKLGYE